MGSLGEAYSREFRIVVRAPNSEDAITFTGGRASSGGLGEEFISPGNTARNLQMPPLSYEHMVRDVDVASKGKTAGWSDGR
jgi:hypothetical protein